MSWALYVRVSTNDQNINTQIEFLKDYACKHEYEPFSIYSDVGVSGAKASRPEFNRLLRDIRKGLVDGVLVYKLDRIGRSTQHLLNLFEEFDNLNIKFVSATQDINTTNPSGKLMMRMLMVMAEYERDLIIDRVNAGIKRAKSDGIHCGRPKGSKDKTPRKKGGYYLRYMNKKGRAKYEGEI